MGLNGARNDFSALSIFEKHDIEVALETKNLLFQPPAYPTLKTTISGAKKFNWVFHGRDNCLEIYFDFSFNFNNIIWE